MTISSKLTSSEVLTCELCRARITDLELGTVYWNSPEGSQPSGLVLAHKECGLARGMADSRRYTHELYWYADWETALRQLARVAGDYDWSGDDLTRIVLIAWAASCVATAKNREDARHFNDSGMF